MVERRLGIRSLLQKGLSYREIGRLLDVMPTTVYFVKRGFVRTPRNPRPPYTYTSDKSRKRRRPGSGFPAYKGRGRWRFL